MNPRKKKKNSVVRDVKETLQLYGMDKCCVCICLCICINKYYLVYYVKYCKLVFYFVCHILYYRIMNTINLGLITVNPPVIWSVLMWPIRGLKSINLLI